MFIKNCSYILLFDNILSFSSNIFSCVILFLFEKYCLHAFQNGLKLKSTLHFSSYYNFAYLFRFANRFCCHLNFTLSLGYFDLFVLFLRHDIIIICFRRFLLKWAFWFLHIFFVFLGACLHKIETKLLLKAAWDSRHTIKNIQFKLVSNILFEIAVYWFLWFKRFKYCFEHSIYHMMMITQVSFNGICLHKMKVSNL